MVWQATACCATGTWTCGGGTWKKVCPAGKAIAISANRAAKIRKMGSIPFFIGDIVSSSTYTISVTDYELFYRECKEITPDYNQLIAVGKPTASNSNIILTMPTK
ncbi:hypothetical protein [Methylobacter marinus]|uniref:hypothetical protein n=1 Tax=Methylobacter marinus TaxID=34058 RepID=UPI0012EBD2A5|nr:hypothetical protein [Methylobacter marinus]